MAKAKVNPLPIEVLEISGSTGEEFLDLVAEQMLRNVDNSPKGNIEDIRVAMAVAYTRIGMESLVVGSGADLPGIYEVILGLYEEVSKVYEEDYYARPDTKIMLAKLREKSNAKGLN